MKTAVMVGEEDVYFDTALEVPHRKVMVRTAPPAYWNLMTFFISEIGNTPGVILDRMTQLGNMGNWRESAHPSKEQPPNPSKVSRDTFQALLKQKEEIGGIPTSE